MQNPVPIVESATKTVWIAFALSITDYANSCNWTPCVCVPTIWFWIQLIFRLRFMLQWMKICWQAILFLFSGDKLTHRLPPQKFNQVCWLAKKKRGVINSRMNGHRVITECSHFIYKKKETTGKWRRKAWKFIEFRDIRRLFLFAKPSIFLAYHRFLQQRIFMVK